MSLSLRNLRRQEGLLCGVEKGAGMHGALMGYGPYEILRVLPETT